MAVNYGVIDQWHREAGKTEIRTSLSHMRCCSLPHPGCYHIKLLSYSIQRTFIENPLRDGFAQLLQN